MTTLFKNELVRVRRPVVVALPARALRRFPAQRPALRCRWYAPAPGAPLIAMWDDEARHSRASLFARFTWPARLAFRRAQTSARSTRA